MSPSKACGGSDCGCRTTEASGPEKSFPASGRREFLKGVAAGAAVVALRPWNAMAGPFTRADFEKLVPEDKKLSAEWLQSLTARGEPLAYRGADLEKIGMPVGGICAGQLYLGGDGRLWHWDIFNREVGTGAEHYAGPLKPSSPIDQGFALKIGTGPGAQVRPLSAPHWKDIAFVGEYPVGDVTYGDPACPVTVRMEAFSPFIPLSVDDSSLPAVVMRFFLRNTGAEPVEASIAGWLENDACLDSASRRPVVRRSAYLREAGLLSLECTAAEPHRGAQAVRADVSIDDFEGPLYEGWTATGTAFGAGPAVVSEIPAYQGNVAAHGKRAVNSHATAPGTTVEEKDSATGRLASRPFVIERDYISFLIGGGAHAGKTCMNLVIDGRVEASATGANDNRMARRSWYVRPWLGKSARLEIVDEVSGAWGNIGVDDIIQTDTPAELSRPLAEEADFGSMALALLSPESGDFAGPLPAAGGAAVFDLNGVTKNPVDGPAGDRLFGGLGRRITLAPGAKAMVTFVIAWRFQNLRMDHLKPGRWYGTKFASARDVAAYIASNYERLVGGTLNWRRTWKNSTLPHWFLDRTFLNTSILATSTCRRFSDGRFYSREGVGCCEGTCGHVWHYAHAMARLFPSLERHLRADVDLGLALQPDGSIHFRGEYNDIPAIDAQAGTILRVLREHQMSADDSFLRGLWPKVKTAMDWLIAKDGDGDGLIEGNQHNTLDTDWFGPVAWLSGLYLSALQAAASMADDMGDPQYAAKCRGILERGRNRFLERLYDDGYFVNKVDPTKLDAINSGTGCEIDQVMGQGWAFQVGLPRVLPERETRSALRSLWRYNFTPDVGPYRDRYKAGRWYAMPGEAGLLMCTFPRSDWDYTQAKGRGPDWAAGYFNECMNGFEYQAAGHMIWEGLVTEGLAVTRAVHDRYHPSRRNPWNEIECGDHYVRSMASYGVYLAVCGFEYHGPRGRMAFAPRVSPENFRAAFTAAEGWGSYSQARSDAAQRHTVELGHGVLRLTSFGMTLAAGRTARAVKVTLDGGVVAAVFSQSADRVEVRFAKPMELGPGARLEMDCTTA
jgi:non-lysosomal glucosylceramidase